VHGEKKIVVCIASYKNQEYYEKNLDSVFSQNYSNYRVIYVDDASPDMTYLLVSSYIKENNLEDKISLSRNEENHGAMYNYYHMIHSCEKDEIIVMLDGDDWFASENVLQRLNQAYLNPKVWVTYGTFEHYPFARTNLFAARDTKIFKEGTHRDLPFLWTHLRTFYAGLFKIIPAEYFQDDQRNFFKTGWDVAIMFNLIDMARDHIYYIPETLYIYNEGNPINDFKVHREDQLNVEELVRQRPPLPKMEKSDFL